MNRTATATALCLLAATAAVGARAETFTDNARVRSVEPQYESVQIPRNECTSQWVNDPQPVVTAPRSYGGAIIGGVAGAVLGNQVGRGHGREAATAAGAIVGAVAGDRIGNDNYNNGAVVGYQQQPREVSTCRTVNEVQNRLTGYRVTYEYRGHVSTAFMRSEPGQSVPVQVSVMPLER
ncbi:glycine zipper 2TM domain-containing protein [Ramlibacter sp.]|uniref:glycine zipper 2TM domain-containing protein n=1 Tax=Ramlibacter sp. TaxID=1917967 RepID=UPI0017F347C8|nr:glycine zipper 2TM domain-containing protein [Ramlibacter sp.]MBA2672057.1 glycine zipper 2TM domain-containing protein [Ramlibacter sp.]